MMKNIYMILLTVVAALYACSSDDAVVEQKTFEAGKTYFMTVDATKGVNETASPTYRRALTLSGNTLTPTWAIGEKVYVYPTTSVTPFWFDGCLEAKSAGSTTQLDGALSLPSGWTEDISVYIGYAPQFKLQFPRSGDLDYTGQVGTLSDIATKYDYAIATGVMFDIENDHITAINTATFESQQAIVKFTLNDGTDALSPTALTIAYGSEPLELTRIPNTTYTTNGAGILFVAVPGFTDANVTLTATCSSGTYTYTRSNVTFANGKYYEISVKMKKQ